MLGKRKPEVPLSSNEPEKAVRIMEKKAPALRDKELNHKLAVVPRRFVKSSNETDVGSKSKEGFQMVDRGTGGSSIRREFADINDGSQREIVRGNKGNLLTIQRQLLQLERQQAQLMNMLQDFMDGSHDGMITLEKRVCGVERAFEDMARDLSILANNKRGGNNMLESSGPLGNDNSIKNDDPMTGREDNGPARAAVTEEEDEEPGWMKWGNALDALHADDVDMAFAIVLAAEDDVMLAELMDRMGPVIYRLSSDIGAEVLEAVG
ncbi:TORTIFOLIA1-like protein 1 [Bidens hawaiensis]|uniref:TORTIFOLIA1-like protein 1 n=1 Tax=Bidens hawaiensis TaxID=980011 RepID=UPI004049DCEF